MMTPSRTISALLAALMLSAPLITACSDGDTPKDTSDAADPVTDAVTTTEAVTTAEAVPVTPYDYITKKYDGATFTFVCPTDGTRYSPGQFVTEEETGDIIMDGAYRRNLTVSEKLDVKFAVHQLIGMTKFPAAIRGEIQAQTDAYDLVNSFVQTIAPLVTDGIFIPSTELPYQSDISEKDWYNANLNSALSIDGKQYMFFSDMTCITLSCTYGMFYNATLGEKYGVKELDKLALDGKWTLDKLKEYSENVSQDLDQNGIWDVKDQYGLSQFTALSQLRDTATIYQYGFGEKTAVLNKDGQPEIALNLEKMADIAVTLNDLFYTGNRNGHTFNGKDAAVAFSEGRILFWNAIIMHAGNYMRDMKDSFVILPMPKWDDKQEEYYTSISNSSSLLSMVPVSAKNKEFSSAVFDVLSYEGQKEIIPAFFEHSMKLKFSRDNTASQLFDIIRAGTTVDFGMLYDGGTGMFTIMAKLIKDKSTNFASEFAAIKDKTLAHYQDIMNLMKK